MLTEQQTAHWNAFGFVVLPKLFTPEEVKQLKIATTKVINQNDGTQAFSNPPTWALGASCERHPLLTDWLVDDRIYSIPQQLLGPDFLLETNAASIFWGDTLWHGGFSPQESPESFYTVAKVVMYFDTLNKDNGCLRVIPGTHLRPFGQHVWPQQNLNNRDAKPFGVSQEDVPSVPLESEPGDVIVFTERVLHSAFGGKKGRLQLSSEYSINPVTEEQISKLLSEHDRLKYSHHPSQSFIDSSNPRIQRMVSRLIELGYTPLQV